MDFEQVEKLFRYDVELPPAEDAEPAEGEEAPPKRFDRRLNDKLCPTFVIVLQASETLCKKHWQDRESDSKESMKAFHEAMYEYRSKNLTDNVHSVADFFQDVARPGEHKDAEADGENKEDDADKPKGDNKSIGVFNLPVEEGSGKEKAAEDIFESGRIYMEREGRPFNYLVTEEEVAAGLLERLAEKEKVEDARKQAEAKLQETSSTCEDTEAKLQVERLRLVAEHEEEQRRLDELPLREYLMKYMVPTLTEGLIEVCKVLPGDPVDYLSTYLESHMSETGPPEH